MEQNKQPLRNEPGRRYDAVRIKPRTAADVLKRPPQRHVSSDEPIAQQSPDKSPIVQPPKHLDFTPRNVKPKKKRTFSAAKPALPRPHRSLVLKRHIVERADEHRKQVRRVRKRHFAGFFITSIVLIAFAIVGWAFWDFLPGLRSISIPFFESIHLKNAPETTMNKPTSTLDETKPSTAEIESYQAAPDAPRILRIPTLNLEARVKPFGVSLTGEPIAPSNIYNVGWFDDSNKPGEQGAVLLNGHTTGPTQQGIFHNIGSLQPGDQITLERGDKIVFKYVVVKVMAYNNGRTDMNAATQSITPGKPGLNLMTTATSYDGVAGRSEQRYIVFAIQQ